MLVALLVCLIPTTIGALLSAIGIAGMDRLVQRNVLAMSGRAVEAAGDVSTLLLDKTGTITYGNRMAAEFLPVGGAAEEDVARVSLLSSLADETPEGRSIVALAESAYGLTPTELDDAELVPFTAQTRMSGVDFADPTAPGGGARCARAPPTRSAAGWRGSAAPSPTTWRRWSSPSPGAAGPRWPSRTAPGWSGSSTSRTP